jgi:hypothetical protein
MNSSGSRASAVKVWAPLPLSSISVRTQICSRCQGQSTNFVPYTEIDDVGACFLMIEKCYYYCRQCGNKWTPVRQILGDVVELLRYNGLHLHSQVKYRNVGAREYTRRF